MKSKLMLIVTIILLMLLCSSLAGCKDNEIKEEQQGIESGFTPSGDDPVPPEKIGFKAAVREFDLVNVELEIFIGWGSDVYYDTMYDSLVCEIVCYTDQKRENEITLKRIEDFNDRKYICIENLETNRYEYSYSEIMKIPKELFIGNSGEIFIVTKFPAALEGHQYGGWNSFLYTKIGENRVRIDEWWKKHQEENE